MYCTYQGSIKSVDICYFNNYCNTAKWVDTMTAINNNLHLF